jgi:DNA-binding transcriptional MerR regulator
MDKAAAAALLPLPPIPAKRYFTIGEVSELCGVKPHVLRYWEQEFTQLKPVKRRGNRRYYQHHEVLLIRRIRDLLYEQGFTINGARNRLSGGAHAHEDEDDLDVSGAASGAAESGALAEGGAPDAQYAASVDLERLRSDIVEVRDALRAAAAQVVAEAVPAAVSGKSGAAVSVGAASVAAVNAVASAGSAVQELELDFGSDVLPAHSPEQET